MSQLKTWIYKAICLGLRCVQLLTLSFHNKQRDSNQIILIFSERCTNEHFFSCKTTATNLNQSSIRILCRIETIDNHLDIFDFLNLNFSDISLQ